MLEDTVRSVLSCSNKQSIHREILVVDNGSTDDTRDRMRQFVEAGVMTLIHEPKAGLSHARNSGASAAQGEWLIFLDDDVFVKEDFIDAYVAAMHALPEASYLGGAILPVFDEPLSPTIAIIAQRHPWCFSALDYGPSLKAFESSEHPYGANMAVRTALVKRFPFRLDLGFKHGVLTPGEETAFFGELACAGHIGYWIPTAPVEHRMPKARAKFSYVFRRAVGQGYRDAVTLFVSKQSSLWAIRTAFTALLRLPITMLRQRHQVGASLFEITILSSLFFFRYFGRLGRLQKAND